MAATVWDEATATQDLDVVVVFRDEPPALDPLRPILDRLPEEQFPRRGEHIEIAGVPVQFLPAWTHLAAEAVRRAAELAYDPDDASSPSLRVIAPTYLAAMWQSDRGALTPRRSERIARLREAGLLDEDLLKRLLSG